MNKNIIISVLGVLLVGSIILGFNYTHNQPNGLASAFPSWLWFFHGGGQSNPPQEPPKNSPQDNPPINNPPVVKCDAGGDGSYCGCMEVKNYINPKKVVYTFSSGTAEASCTGTGGAAGIYTNYFLKYYFHVNVK